MRGDRWVASSAGLLGPMHLVEQAEWALAGAVAAAEEGLPLLEERADPLVTTLLLSGLAASLADHARGWLAARRPAPVPTAFMEWK